MLCVDDDLSVLYVCLFVCAVPPECVSEVWHQQQDPECVMDVTCNGHVGEDLRESTRLEDEEEEPQNPYADTSCVTATETQPSPAYLACNGAAPVAMAMPGEADEQACGGGTDGNRPSVIGSVEGRANRAPHQQEEGEGRKQEVEHRKQEAQAELPECLSGEALGGFGVEEQEDPGQCVK